MLLRASQVDRTVERAQTARIRTSPTFQLTDVLDILQGTDGKGSAAPLVIVSLLLAPRSSVPSGEAAAYRGTTEGADAGCMVSVSGAALRVGLLRPRPCDRRLAGLSYSTAIFVAAIASFPARDVA